MSAMHDAVLDAGCLECCPAIPTFITAIGIDRLLIARDQGASLVWLGRSRRGEAGAADQPRTFIDADVETIAEIALAVLAGPVRAGLAWVSTPGTNLCARRIMGRPDDRRIQQRALFEHQPTRIELLCHLLEAALHNARLGHCRPEPADRRLVRRAAVQRKAAEPSKRQTVQQRLLEARIGQVIQSLKIQRLQHRQQRIRRPTCLARANTLQKTAPAAATRSACPDAPASRSYPAADQSALLPTTSDHPSPTLLSATMNHLTSPNATPFAEESCKGGAGGGCRRGTRRLPTEFSERRRWDWQAHPSSRAG
ncbi:MAG: hypothetical protein JWL96_714 [Sphingomonas bacterium]|nr:hypothetical protein [Sphingomonas bacterium]